MPTFDPRFIAELKLALNTQGHSELAKQVDELQVFEFTEGRQPIHQFIYVVPKDSLPTGSLPELCLGDVPGLFCLFVYCGRIVVVETLSRDVLRRDTK